MDPLDPVLKMEIQGAGTLNRFHLKKSYQGDLWADSEGEMLTARPPVEKSGGYIALEQVRGELAGRTGTFILQHFGLMGGAEGEHLLLRVVPGSGTDGLSGISGNMSLQVSEKGHSYQFNYELD